MYIKDTTREEKARSIASWQGYINSQAKKSGKSRETEQQ